LTWNDITDAVEEPKTRRWDEKEGVKTKAEFAESIP
jgi:hypothetical protein